MAIFSLRAHHRESPVGLPWRSRSRRDAPSVLLWSDDLTTRFTPTHAARRPLTLQVAHFLESQNIAPLANYRVSEDLAPHANDEVKLEYEEEVDGTR